jgi:tRNA pseudouridine55 synthase
MARRRRPASVHGLAVVDKPTGITSHDVVDLLRRRFHERQVGHAGTLDPDATGVLLVGVGDVTRLMRFLTGARKTYTGEVVLGVETSTLDAAGEVTATHDMHAVTVDDARAVVAAHLVGDILQVPPMVSAVKVGGRRLHELAREGVEVERAPRPVNVGRFDVASSAEAGVLRIEVECSSGTYVRTLAADLGHLLGGGAHLRALRRTAVGSFTVDEAAPPDESPLLTPAEALRDLARVTVDAAGAEHVAHGRILPSFPGSGPWAVLGPSGDLLAVYEAHQGRAKPTVVLARAGVAQREGHE